MALDERYLISLPLNQYFVDKDTGLPLAGGTLTFYRDVARNTVKTVYQLTGAPGNYTYNPLPNPITLSSVGTVENASGDNEIIYFYPYDEQGNIDLYYVVCENANGVTQFTREAWPNLVLGNDPAQDDFPVNNQISNPQFSRVFINDTETIQYTVSGSELDFAFAPDWDFVINGTGTVTVTRTAVAGASGVPTHPPYYITVTVPSGISSCYLRQRMYDNSGLWGSTADIDVYLSTVLVGRNQNVGSASVTMYYEPSNGGSAQLILSGSVIQGEWSIIKSGSQDPIQESADANTGNDGYIDIYVSFPTNSVIDISSIQVVPTVSSVGFDSVQYDQRSSNRETAYLGDYYSPLLQQKRIASLLVGWDFPLNPAQWGDSGTLAATPAAASYIWDQTIAIDTDGSVTYARNALTGGLEFTTATSAANAVSMVQLLDLPTVREILANKLAVNVNAFRTTAGGDVTMRVYLYRAANAASYPSLASNEFIASVATTGVATSPFTGWTEIARGGLDTATATINSYSTSADWVNPDYDYGFTNWEITSASQLNDTEKFAILVTFAYDTTATVFTVNSISLTNNNIPCRPGLITYQESVENCQYYYEKSYEIGVDAGTVTDNGQRGFGMNERYNGTDGTNVFSPQCFTCEYKLKASAPTMTFYDPTTGTADRIYYATWITTTGYQSAGAITASTGYTLQGQTTERAFYVPTSTATLLTVAIIAAATNIGVERYHFVADARLGL